MSQQSYFTSQQQYALYIAIVVVALCSNRCTCNPSQVPSRFYYNNQDIETTAANGDNLNTDFTPDNEAQHTNVQLLRDIGTKPLSFYMELSNVSDIEEFLDRFVEKDKINPKLGIVENLKRSVERAAAINPQPALCKPDNAVVALAPATPFFNPEVLYFPACTRVKRCGGCCNHPLMSCQATETKVNNYKVLKYNTTDSTIIGQEVIPIEEHVKCACSCNIKAEDCNAYQSYDISRCVCICNNADARHKCSLEEHKIWDEQKCRCVCRENISCSTGSFFDHNLCGCVQKSDGGDIVAPPPPEVPFDRKRFIVKATPIETDNSTIYDTI